MTSKITLHMSFGYCFLTVVVIQFFHCGYMPIGAMGFKVKLIPRLHIDSELFPANLSLTEKHHRIVEISRARALNYRPITPETLKPRIMTVLNSVYVIQMEVGSATKPFSTFLLLDTGSDDTWFQCDGCSKCFDLRGGSFKYRDSRTYKAVTCDHPLCVPKLCSSEGNICLYSIEYIAGAFTKGVLSGENFTFPTNTEGFVTFQNVVFGCGLINQNIRFGTEPLTTGNFIAGIFGLGMGQRSFLRQLEYATRLRFSYCLTPYMAPVPFSYLWFGPEAQISGFYKTTMLLPQGMPRYFVICTGISLDGKKLPIDPAVFQLKPDRSGGFAFDTGAGSTLLAKSAYQVLKDSINSYFARNHGWHPSTGHQTAYDLCYVNLPGTKPSMTYHFEGDADLVVDPSATFEILTDAGTELFCLVVLPHWDDKLPNLLGAFQQVDYRFLFDDETSTISFRRETCSNQ